MLNGTRRTSGFRDLAYLKRHQPEEVARLVSGIAHAHARDEHEPSTGRLLHNLGAQHPRALALEIAVIHLLYSGVGV